MLSDSEESIRLDQEIANRLQNEHPEQFVTLVRMHLSFELDLNTDTENDPTSIDKIKNKKWKGFHKKAKACASTKSTSPETTKTSLTKQNIRDVKQLISFLLQEQNISQEGIFRKTGSLNRQNELKSALVQGIPISLENGDFTAHDCASVLKSFLADLSEPLLTELYYPAYCQVAEFCHSKDSLAVREDRLLNTIQLLFLLLPKENKILLKHLIDMLYKTIQHEATNKMSADNLATLFTPHLICPRKLTPEALHATAQQMCSIISFMIKTGSRLFHIPPKLATDIRAFFVDRKRRQTMSPEHILNESITSDSVANTVYTFVDRKKTAEAHEMNSTDTALAQLYAHIQSLPESSKKKKLIKQFNRENGHGTPLQVLMLREKNSGSAVKGPKSIGDSIKRHIFHKSLMSKTPKRNSHTPVGFQTPNGTISSVPKQRVLFQSPLSSSSSSSSVRSSSSPMLGKRCSTTSTTSTSSSDSRGGGDAGSGGLRPAIMRRSASSVSVGSYRCETTRRTVEFADAIDEAEVGGKRCRLEDEDHQDDEQMLEPVDDEDFVEQDDDDIGEEDGDEEEVLPGETLSDTEEDRFCSPAVSSESGLSDSRSKFKSEPNLSTIVNEQTRKEKKISFLKHKLIKGVSMGNLRLPFGADSRSAKKTSSSASSLLKCCFEDSLKDGGGKKPSIASIASPDCRLIAATSSSLFGVGQKCAEEYDQINTMNDNLDTNWNVGYLTSTPAISGRDSMSPITKSTQRMPKSMQESIMTPRSRKPVMLLAGMNGLDQHSTTTSYALSQSSFSSLREEDEEEAAEVATNLAWHSRATATAVTAASSTESSSGGATTATGQGTDEEASSLTSTFREYLLSRSVMTDSPADLSFSSQPEDFDSSSADLIEDLNESKMSESLLFCLDGNRPIDDDDDSQVTLVNAAAARNELMVLPSGTTELDETSL
uniref:Putative rho gtpase-activating protein 19 n=1 Tax=Culex tarsalis TaxID=7177 RepID=A0A1Q3F2Z0_CULTA